MDLQMWFKICGKTASPVSASEDMQGTTQLEFAVYK